jgi:hypothetical protein
MRGFDDSDHAIDPTHYSFRNSPAGAPIEFYLRDSELEWRRGNQAFRVAYADVRQIRLLFRPVTMQVYRFITEIRTTRGPKLTLASTSWRSMVDHERLDARYRAFVNELHRRVAASGATVVYRSGAPGPLYWLGVVVFATLMGASTLLAIRALEAGDWQAAGLIGLMVAFFLWQTGGFFLRNRPGVYAPDRLPDHLLP